MGRRAQICDVQRNIVRSLVNYNHTPSTRKYAVKTGGQLGASPQRCHTTDNPPSLQLRASGARTSKPGSVPPPRIQSDHLSQLGPDPRKFLTSVSMRQTGSFRNNLLLPGSVLLFSQDPVLS